MILSQGEDADEADAQAARCTLALTGGMPFLDGHVVVELRDIDNAPVVRMGISDNLAEHEKKKKVLPLIGNDMTGRSARRPPFLPKDLESNAPLRVLTLGSAPAGSW